MPGTILFVGNDADRAGAAVALLHLLTWLRTERWEEPRVLLLGGGDLLADYERLAPTYRLEAGAGFARRALRRLRVMSRAPRVPAALRRERIDLVYLNTVAVARLARQLKATWRAPVLLHVRELEMSIRANCGSQHLRAALEHVDGCVASIRPVVRLLIERYGVAAETIHQISPGLALPARGTAWSPEARRALRAEVGIPADAFVVGGCGTLNWWKAPELFVLAAHRFRRLRPEASVHFLWVGGRVGSAEHDRLWHDVDRLGLSGTVHFVGAQAEPHRYFALFDAFLLTSREDTLPFVCVEAAALGLPIICFEDSGGAPGIVEGDAGFVVPYLDLDAAGDRLAALMDDPALRRRLGDQAATKARARYGLEHLGRGLGPVLDRYIRGSA